MFLPVRLAIVIAAIVFAVSIDAAAAAPPPAEMRQVADRAAIALSQLPIVNGDVIVRGGNLYQLDSHKEHTAALGYSYLRAEARSSKPSERARLESAAIKMVSGAINRYAGAPFPPQQIGQARQAARLVTNPSSSLRRAVAQWENFLSTWGPASRPAFSQSPTNCFATDACYNNWHLMQGLALADVLSSGLTGAPGSYLADRANSRTWVTKMLGERLMAAAGPESDGWSKKACVLSDPPNNPLAYHVFSTWLLGELAEQHPDLLTTPLKMTLDCNRNMLSALTAPDGDVAIAGRSQLQSWTLAAGILVAAQAYADDWDPAWAALADRLWSRLNGPLYRDPGGFFAVTPSARSHMKAGIDLYADPAEYNGLTLMLLNMAADRWAKLSPEPADQIPADRDGGLTDLAGARVVIRRSGPVWWSWRSSRCSNFPTADLRCDSGLLQAKVLGPLGWTDLLMPRSIGKISSCAGPCLKTIAGYQAFRVTDTSGTPQKTVLNGRFGTRLTDITIDSNSNGITISWPSQAGDTFSGLWPLVSAQAGTSQLTSNQSVITMSPDATLRKAESGPGAGSVDTKLYGWSINTTSQSTITISLGVG